MEDYQDYLTPSEMAEIEEFVRNEMANVSVGICNRMKRDALEIKKLYYELQQIRGPQVPMEENHDS